MKIAYDLDGVLALWTPQDRQDFRGIKGGSEGEWQFYSNLLPNKSPVLKKCGVIITSRPIRLYKTTFAWLEEHKIKHKGLYCVGDTKLSAKLQSRVGNKDAEKVWALSQAKCKARVINKLKIDTYVEDRVDVVNHLMLLCPKTNIVWYKEE